MRSNDRVLRDRRNGEPRLPGRRSDPGPSGHQRRRWRWSLFLGAWTLIGILFVGPFIVQSIAERTQIPWSKVSSVFLGWYLWGLLFPLIWLLARRLPFERRSWLRWSLLNLGLGLAVSSLYVILAFVKTEIIQAISTGRLSFGTLAMVPRHLVAGIAYYVLVYFVIVAVIHAISFYDKYRERELNASRLEGQLALARLQMLKAQLHPHFLFNTLNAISALMHRDVDAADRMITQLSDLLRLSIDQDDRHQVSLGCELEFLDRYLAIERIRFRDRLAVEKDVEPPCLQAQVPRLILQPLVENSIRHGIAMRSAAGRVTIRASCKGSRLEIVVADDGPGLTVGRGLREGVGLANTRARLEQLYGNDYRFELVNADGGGLQAVLEIPFETQARFRGEGEPPGLPV
ncbi:MAG: histidine kinase [bacterium]|nr:histidine kinase [bacterium]